MDGGGKTLRWRREEKGGRWVDGDGFEGWREASVVGGRRKRRRGKGEGEARGEVGAAVAEPAGRPARPVMAVAGGAASRFFCLNAPPASVCCPTGTGPSPRDTARYLPPRKLPRRATLRAKPPAAVRTRAGLCRKQCGAARTA